MKVVKELGIVLLVSFLLFSPPAIIEAEVSPGSAQTERVTPEKESFYGEKNKSFDKMIEVGVITFIALWLLRVILTDLKGEVQRLNDNLISIGAETQKTENYIAIEIGSIKAKIEELGKNVERIERKVGGKDE